MLKWLVAGVVALGFTLTACFPAPRGADQEPVKPLKFKPIGYYQAQCARCHGPYGLDYTEHFYAITDFDKLRADVKRMCEGPGLMPLDGLSLDAEVDYHKALVHKGPFISWNAFDGTTLTGEVTKGAKVTAKAGETDLAVTTEKLKWTVKLPAGIDYKSLKLTATVDKKQTLLDLSSSAWSTKVEDTK